MRGRFFAGLFLTFATVAHAAVPQNFTVQGLLRDSGGQLQSEMVTVTVKLFDLGGTLLGTPVAAQQVMAQNGLFTLPVPVDGPLLDKLASAAPVMELTVNADVFPRQPLTPDVFALLCGTADTANSLKGATISAAAPAAGQALVFSGGQYTPTSVVTAVTASAPLASTGGATPNLSLSGIVPVTNGGTGLSAAPVSAGQYLRSTGTNWSISAILAADLPALAGDVKGTLVANTVTALRGIAVSTAAPANGQPLVYGSGATQWAPGSVDPSFGGNRWGGVFTRSGISAIPCLNPPNLTPPNATPNCDLNNPLTSACSCPAGFSTAVAAGSYDGSNTHCQYTCYR
jgi:hypothetical protein